MRVVAEQLQAVYPEVLRSIDYITKVVLSEEQTFTATLESGLKILQEEMEKLKAQGGVGICPAMRFLSSMTPTAFRLTSPQTSPASRA